MPFSIAGPGFQALPTIDGVNRAADQFSSERRSDSNNAAETAIAGRLDTVAGEATIDVRNATSQISALQKADESLQQAGILIQAAQELSTRKVNPALSEQDQLRLEKTSLDLLDEAAAGLANSEFNGQRLFSAESIDIEDLKARLDQLRVSSDIDSDGLSALQGIVSEARGFIGAEQRSTMTSIERAMVTRENASRSGIDTTDMATEVSQRIQQRLQFQANVFVIDSQRLASQSVINLLTA